jgi:molybdate/tungstate transport system substrate-binding protein
MKSRRWLRAACLFTAAGLAAASLAGATPARADEKFTVAFAGSMGVMMDKGLGPAFQARTGAQYQGIGQASLGLAHLLAAKSLLADVFVPVSPAPMKLVETAGLVPAGAAVPVASTQIVLAYSPKSKFAAALARAQGDGWLKILQDPALRFGRTDPDTDPQGQYVLYALQLAELYYRQPGVAGKIAGGDENTAQIFAEPSLLARLQDGQIDATLGYRSAVVSQKLPYITLPAEINFSDPSKAKDWYARATLTITAKGVTKTVHPGLLVFYAAALNNAPDAALAAAFIDFLTGAQAQAIFADYGYGPPRGPKL